MITGTQLILENSDGGEGQIFMVNAAPVLDGWGRAKGAIATFDDVTALEQKTRELERKTVELENRAFTRDPLDQIFLRMSLLI